MYLNIYDHVKILTDGHILILLIYLFLYLLLETEQSTKNSGGFYQTVGHQPVRIQINKLTKHNTEK